MSSKKSIIRRKSVKEVISFYFKIRFSNLIFSAGMPRSGSTLMYNIIRQILMQHYDGTLSSGWVEEIFDLPQADTFLIKAHNLDKFQLIRANCIFYSYRDMRDALVSLSRKFGCQPSLEIARKWIEQYKIAEKHAQMMVRYEDMVMDIPTTVHAIAQHLQIQIDVSRVIASLPVMDAQDVIDGQYSKVTLLHRNHATGTICGEWRTVLDKKLQKQLASEFSDWFQLNRYPLA